MKACRPVARELFCFEGNGVDDIMSRKITSDELQVLTQLASVSEELELTVLNILSRVDAMFGLDKDKDKQIFKDDKLIWRT